MTSIDIEQGRVYSILMDIVDPAPDDITLDEASRIAGCGAKTLRRAVQAGRLPRRYAISPRGPQLVFGHAELARWLASRRAKGHTTARSPSAQARRARREWSELPAQVRQLVASLDESREMIATFTAKLREQDDAIAAMRAALAQLAGRLAGLEARGAGAQQSVLDLEPGPPATR